MPSLKDKPHSAWQVWSSLQLTEMFDDGDIPSAIQAIAWGKIDAARQEHIVERALRDYNATRTEVGDESEIYRADVGDIERDLDIFESSLMREIDLTRFAQRDRNHRILNRIKNRVQEYLMMVERNMPPPEPGED